MLQKVVIECLKQKMLDSGVQLECLNKLSAEKEFSPNAVAILSLDPKGLIVITNLIDGRHIDGIVMELDSVFVIVDMDLLHSLRREAE